MHLPEVLWQLTEAVQAEAPDHVLVTGDLVHIGLPEEIAAAARWLEALGPPERVLLVPGNHDIYAADSWPAARDCWGDYLQTAGVKGALTAYPVLRQIGSGRHTVNLVGLCSAVPSPLFTAWGRLGAGQLERLDSCLAQHTGLHCLLVHHPPLPRSTGWRKGLRDAAALEALLRQRAAALLLHGHVHRNVERPGPAGARVFGTASASSAVLREAAASCYRVFDLEPQSEGWRIQMRLMALPRGGALRALRHESWEVPLSSASDA